MFLGLTQWCRSVYATHQLVGLRHMSSMRVINVAHSTALMNGLTAWVQTGRMLTLTRFHGMLSELSFLRAFLVAKLIMSLTTGFFFLLSTNSSELRVIMRASNFMSRA